MDYGGMEFPEISTLQDQVQIDYLLRQLRWDKVVANDFLVTLDSVQLCSKGIYSAVLNTWNFSNSPRWRYINLAIMRPQSINVHTHLGNQGR